MAYPGDVFASVSMRRDSDADGATRLDCEARRTMGGAWLNIYAGAFVTVHQTTYMATHLLRADE